MIEQKKALRRQISTLKRQLSETDRLKQTEAIFRQLEDSPFFETAKTLLLYWAMADEVPTQAFINRWYKKKAIYLPVIDGQDLKIVQYLGEDKLVAGAKYGIPEPNGPALIDESIIEIVVVPGVAFDAHNNRMGRGAGYYDRILKRLPSALKIGLAFDFQMVEQLPVEPHDIAMDQIISG
ncbi:MULTISPECIES: 5-formyltetrahydrofolate cyclo-ligase [unclassified Carboxylicivirga]|uniref:5-formyltetrahydrofolate cyclo-ligase n=1 Tax=Carboxylicivirga TaxID=1628153 RepID=UPI003D335A2D